MSTLFLLLVGAFIGWNTPQPKKLIEFQKRVKAFVVAQLKKLFTKKIG